MARARVTRQVSRFTVLSPSTVVHIGIMEYRGNKLNGVTKCGVSINPLTWTRLPASDIKELSKCGRCFPTP